jgi:hypothetical protein
LQFERQPHAAAALPSLKALDPDWTVPCWNPTTSLAVIEIQNNVLSSNPFDGPIKQQHTDYGRSVGLSHLAIILNGSSIVPELT